MKERGSVRSTLEIDLRSPTVKLNWIIVQPCLSRKELKNSRTAAPFFCIFLFLLILRGVHGSGEFKYCQAFTFQMDGSVVGAEVQKCGDSGLELVVRERSNFVLS